MTVVVKVEARVVDYCAGNCCERPCRIVMTMVLMIAFACTDDIQDMIQYSGKSDEARKIDLALQGWEA